MSDPLAVSWEQAAENHRRDALAMSHARRWTWLAQAMDLGFAVARSRASQGFVSVDANGAPFAVGEPEGAEHRPGATGPRAS
ncbi:MAG: hypothetical protein KF823_00930 [Xanthomonadales bacterium]|nr:hypothetical protein [Xanthomonadales bacterium]